MPAFRYLPGIAFGLFACLLAFALVRHHSPVPFWDMWDGYLGFYIRVLEGDISAWWYQHNEHRIVLTRVLFWIDLALFSGQSVFLIAVNYLLAITGSLLLVSIFRNVFRGRDYRRSHWLLLTLIVIMPLSWMQEENLSWAFQSQFFLAQLLPLAAFFLFYLSEKDGNSRYFWASLMLGFASIGTMANGVAVLPLLTLAALLASKQRMKTATIFAFTSVIALSVYFYGYESPPGHGSLLETLNDQPLRLLQYVALYIGSPFFYLVNIVVPGHGIAFYTALIMGSGLMLGCLSILVISLRRPADHIFEIIFLCFALYIGATAFGAGGGRLIFGLEQALSGRYRTPAILLWLCFFMISLRAYPELLSGRLSSRVVDGFLLVTILLLVVSQLSVLKSEERLSDFERRVGVLAMVLNIKDAAQIGQVYPWVNTGIALSRSAVAHDLSIFGPDQPFDGVGVEKIGGLPVDVQTAGQCRGHLDEAMLVEGQTDFVKIRGWIFEPGIVLGQPLFLLREDGVPIGYLLVGGQRSDVAQAVALAARNSGFLGYLDRELLKNSQLIYVKFGNEVCHFASSSLKSVD